MGNQTVRITVAEAIVRYLIAQRCIVDGAEQPLVPAALAIFGHGNVTSLGHSLQMHRDELPTWRGQNEQGMGLAATAFTKAMRRQQFLLCTSSVGPGATNMVTAAGVAMANRLPVLFISGDTFASRLPDPVLQQVEHFGSPSTTVNDAFRPVVRFWDRIMHPAQVLASLPQAVDTMVDPAEAGPAFIGLPQDIGAEAYEYPVAFFAPQLRYLNRPRPDTRQVREAVALLKSAQRPVIIAGGGVHYSLAEPDLAMFAERRAIPVLETVAGKSTLVADHPCYAGPLGVTGAAAANAVLGEADVVLAVGTRLQDFTTGSWTAFAPNARIIALNAARFDARKHQSMALVADAREGLAALDAELGSWQSPWPDRASRAQAQLRDFVAQRITPDGNLPLSYAQVVGAVHQAATADDYVLTAAGGLPGELNINWLSKGVATFDCEYGYSCMGYEISGAWGAAMAHRSGRVLALVGDGSYLMMNSDLYSAVLTGHPFTLVVCDNGGYAVIERLQVGQGGASYNNMLRDSLHADGQSPAQARVDFAAHAAAMGAQVHAVTTAEEVHQVVAATRTSPHTVVIVVKVRESDWTGGGAFWQVGVPEVSERPEVQAARAEMDAGLQAQRRGV